MFSFERALWSCTSRLTFNGKSCSNYFTFIHEDISMKQSTLMQWFPGLQLQMNLGAYLELSSLHYSVALAMRSLVQYYLCHRKQYHNSRNTVRLSVKKIIIGKIKREILF